MAFGDYGCLIKKNGKLQGRISSPLKYKIGYHWEGDELVDNEDSIDETIITCERASGEKVQDSVGGNYHGFVGDKDFMVMFYKTSFSFAFNGLHKYQQDFCGYTTSIWEWFDGRWDSRVSHKKPLVLNIDVIGEFKVEAFDKRNNKNPQVFLAKFMYKGDKYEVLFGYGVDGNPSWYFSKRCYWAPERIYDYRAGKYTGRYRNKNKQDRHLLKRAQAWVGQDFNKEN